MYGSAVVEYGCVSSRIVWIKFSFQGLNCVVVGYEGNGEERDRVWNDTDNTLDSLGNGYRFCILGDLNGWIGD